MPYWEAQPHNVRRNREAHAPDQCAPSKRRPAITRGCKSRSSLTQQADKRLCSMRFTAANAVEMARRSHAPTSRRFMPKPAPLPEPQAPADTNAAAAILRQLDITREAIADTREELRRRMEPHHRASLLRSLDILMDRERILLGIPLPGILKPRQPKQASSATIDVEPLPMLPEHRASSPTAQFNPELAGAASLATEPAPPPAAALHARTSLQSPSAASAHPTGSVFGAAANGKNVAWTEGVRSQPSPR